jgi:hypothetical protein
MFLENESKRNQIQMYDPFHEKKKRLKQVVALGAENVFECVAL